MTFLSTHRLLARALPGVCVLAGTLGLLAAAPAAQAQNLLTNGSFETGDFSGWSLSANTNSTGVAFGPLFAQQGSYYAVLGHVGAPPGSISQTFATTAGQQYNLSYFYASGGSADRFSTLVNGNVLFNDTNIAPSSYSQSLYSFTATGATSTLTFLERNDRGFSRLDNVRVTAVTPEAPALLNMAGALLAPGVGGIVSLRKRKKAKSVA